MDWRHKLLAVILIFSGNLYGSEPFIRLLEPDEAKTTLLSNAEPIEIAVRMNHRVYSFILDTGSGKTVIDERDDPNSPPDGKRDVHQFTVGGQSCEWLKKVTALDLSELERKTRIDTDGILGMDVLSHFVLTMDFDEEILQISPGSEAPKPFGEELDIEFDRFGRPCVALSVTDKLAPRFLVDSGLLGCLRVSHAQMAGIRREGIKPTNVGYSSTTDVFGRAQVRTTYVLPWVKLGSQSLPNAYITVGDENVFGLPVLYRYVVVFDFPRRKSYWKPGKMIAAADRGVLCGMQISIGQNSVWKVTSVVDNSVAHQAGIRADDRIESLDGVAVRYLQDDRWVRRLSHPAKRPIEVAVRREGQTYRFEIPADVAE